jgi:hypothetical protein
MKNYLVLAICTGVLAACSQPGPVGPKQVLVLGGGASCSESTGLPDPAAVQNVRSGREDWYEVDGGLSLAFMHKEVEIQMIGSPMPVGRLEVYGGCGGSLLAAADTNRFGEARMAIPAGTSYVRVQGNIGVRYLIKSRDVVDFFPPPYEKIPDLRKLLPPICQLIDCGNPWIHRFDPRIFDPNILVPDWLGRVAGFWMFDAVPELNLRIYGKNLSFSVFTLAGKPVGQASVLQDPNNPGAVFSMKGLEGSYILRLDRLDIPTNYDGKKPLPLRLYKLGFQQ